MGGGEGRWRRVAQPEVRRETMESSRQGGSCRHLEVAEGFWPLQNSKACHQSGLSGTAKRHCASAAGIGERYQKNSSCAAASSCGVSTWATPRPSQCHSIFSDFLTARKIFFRCPWSVFSNDCFIGYDFQVTSAPPCGNKAPQPAHPQA